MDDPAAGLDVVGAEVDGRAPGGNVVARCLPSHAPLTPGDTRVGTLTKPFIGTTWLVVVVSTRLMTESGVVPVSPVCARAVDT